MSAASPPRVPLNRRRDKRQLSCHTCRQKKLRCDRANPCQRCQDKGLGGSCTYPVAPLNAPAQHRSTGGHSSSSVLARVQQLESLLESVLVAKQEQERSPNSIISERLKHLNVASECQNITSAAAVKTSEAHVSEVLKSGSMQISSTEEFYVSGVHWTAIMDSIAGLREVVSEKEYGHSPGTSRRLDDISGDHPVIEPSSQYTGTSNESRSVPPGCRANKGPLLLSGLVPPASKEELLANLPRRQVVDRYIFIYFNSPISALTHSPSFLRRYEKFWTNPLEAELVWITLLFAIMSVASCLEQNSSPSPPKSEGLNARPQFMEQVVGGLLSSGYSSGARNTMEPLLHYNVIENLVCSDATVGNWILCGTVLRLALRMGYHREPSAFPNITVFEAEMRRRVWMILQALDVLQSIQMGIPRMIRDAECNTALPRNLRDADLDEGSESLPPSRPDSDITPILHMLKRHEMIKVIGNIFDMTLRNAEDQSPCTNPDFMRLDTLLRNTYHGLPDSLKLTSVSACLAASPQEVWYRLSLSILYYKGLIILHRWHLMSYNEPFGSGVSMTKGATLIGTECQQSLNVAESIETCVQAAIDLLQYQDIVDCDSSHRVVFLPALGKLPSTISHEFLMATSVLCKYIHHANTRLGGNNQIDHGLVQKATKALVGARERWLQQCSWSASAEKATSLVDRVLSNHSELEQKNNSSESWAGLFEQDVTSFMEGFHWDLGGDI